MASVSTENFGVFIGSVLPVKLSEEEFISLGDLGRGRETEHLAALRSTMLTKTSMCYLAILFVRFNILYYFYGFFSTHTSWWQCEVRGSIVCVCVFCVCAHVSVLGSLFSPSTWYVPGIELR